MDVRQRYIDEKLYNWKPVFCFAPRISNVPENVEDNGKSTENFTIENFFVATNNKKFLISTKKRLKKIAFSEVRTTAYDAKTLQLKLFSSR